MKLIEYITGSRRGREANRLEREAMEDPFLAAAIEGYDSVYGDHSGQLAQLSQRIGMRSRKLSGALRRRRRIAAISAVAATVLVGASVTILYIYRSPAPSRNTYIADKLPLVSRERSIDQEPMPSYGKGISPDLTSPGMYGEAHAAADEDAAGSHESVHGVDAVAETLAASAFEPVSASTARHVPVPVSASPVSASPVSASPVSVSPVSVSPVSVSPVSVSPVSVSPVSGAVPVSDSNFAAGVQESVVSADAAGAEASEAQVLCIAAADDPQVCAEVNGDAAASGKAEGPEGVVEELPENPVCLSLPQEEVVVKENKGFERYFRENRKGVAKGTVVVEFRVNEHSVPSDIRIVSGISPETDREVIELMLVWPAWEPTGKQRVRMVLEYE